MLIAFVIFRPISLAFGGSEFGHLSILEIFVIIISYALILPILINVRRFELDLISFLILIFCFYIGCSIFLGADIGEVARLALPFIVFFAVRSIVENSKQINVLIFTFTIGYIILLIVSAILVFKGASIAKIEIHTQFERYRGVFLRIHVFAYTALLFSFLYAFILRHFKIQNRGIHWILRFSLLVSIFCLYKTHTRTAIVGFIIFWIIYLWGQKKTYFIGFLIVLFSVGVLYQDKAERIFWKTPEQRDLDRATSGRLTLWKENLSIFSNYDLGSKIFGSNPANNKEVLSKDKNPLKVHGDYLALLLKTGILGLLLYLSIFATLLKDIYKSGLDKRGKFVFYGIVITVMAMNCVSNAYVHRPELSHFFWFIMGLFYIIEKIELENTV
jgi:O-antigen ligase